jgi:ribosomal protein S18 acetylase RimI-like enzyme
MTTISSSIPTTKDNLRPFDVRRDLRAVADLVERCFITTLDADGRRYIQQMHAAAHNPAYLQWASLAAERIPLPLSGYIWEENGNIVGNLSLIQFKTEGRRCYLIANVAVDQHFRRQGIARALTLRAIEHAKRKGAQAVWLHVRAENIPAFNLYTSMGFHEQLRRATWHSEEEIPGFSPVRPITTPAGVTISSPKRQHWPQQQTWLEGIYPSKIIWHMPLKINAFNPSLRGIFYRMLTAISIKQWAALRDGKLFGVLSWQPLANHSDNLWLATSPETEEIAILTLLPHVRRHLPRRGQLSLDYPAERGASALQKAGYTLHQTLIWMMLDIEE